MLVSQPCACMTVTISACSTVREHFEVAGLCCWMLRLLLLLTLAIVLHLIKLHVAGMMM